MPIPTSYTYETFRDYLQKEVLQSVADAMGWVDSDASGGLTSVTLNYFISGASSAFWSLTAPLAVDIPQGTFLKTHAGNPLTVAVEARKGDMHIKTSVVQTAGTVGVAPSVDADGTIHSSAVTFAVRVPTVPAINADAVYDHITDEVLLKMGYTDPEDVPALEISEMSSLGRVEAWRAVAYNTMSDTQLVFGDAVLNRGQVFEQAFTQLKVAEDEHRFSFPAIPSIIVAQPRVNSTSAVATVRF